MELSQDDARRSYMEAITAATVQTANGPALKIEDAKVRKEPRK